MPSSAYQVHRCRFIDWVPDAINCISLHPDLPFLAVGRATGDIEIWNSSHGWHFERRIAGSENNSVQSLCWVGDRLFSAGLHGSISEWDLTNLRIQRSHDSYGGAVWALAASHSGQWLAAGCEDGTVRLFALSADDDDSQPTLVYRRSFSKQPGRITSVVWHAADAELVTGASDGTVRRWSLETGRPSVVINVEHPGQKRAAIVWSVAVMRDWTIVSGDSFGHTQFWDGTMGTLLHSFRQHAADVLAVAVSDDERSVFSGGIDHKVAQLRLVPSTTADTAPGSSSSASVEGGKWLYAASQRWHSHDIRAMLVRGDRLYSAGVDTRICIYPVGMFASAGHKDMVRLTPYPQRPTVHLARQPRLLLCQHRRQLQLYRLGEAQETATPLDEVRSGTSLPLSVGYQHVLDLRPASADNLLCSAISADGRWVASSDGSRVKLFALTASAADTTSSSSQVSVRKARLPSAMRAVAASRAVFSNDGRRLLLGGTDRRLHVLELSHAAASVRHLHTFDTLQVHADGDPAAAAADGSSGEAGSELTSSGPLVALAVSSDGRWLAASDTASRIDVFDLSSLKHHCTLPRFDSGTACLAFRPGSSSLLVATASFRLHVYDVAERALTRWSRQNSEHVPVHVIGNRSKWLGASFSDANPDLLLLYANGFFSLVNLAQPLEPLLSQDDYYAATDGNFKIISMFKPTLFVDWVSGSELVTVERPWDAILPHLPAALFRVRYGT
eukprot:TRINITY_DN3799_c0_g1_i1.p1 TRINITY_DN3799_c0_g1~~TRINITY_DN3799_c0_g1_i1.p1  ORF type:complete len:729 (-),score=241.30 TRINITY_DN3799_c0_g1_i1:172-2358(-)